MTKEVCSAMVDHLPEYTKMLIGTDLTMVVEGFKSDHGFPHCAGVIDDKYIPII